MNWKYKQNYDTKQDVNWLKWGLHSARVSKTRYNTGQDVEIFFYYKDKPIKSYTKKGKLTEKWVEERIKVYFNSVYLDRAMYGSDPEEKFNIMDGKYRILADNT